LIIEIFQIVRSEPMPAEGDPVAETSTNQHIFLFISKMLLVVFTAYKEKSQDCPSNQFSY
jgi:hypothetical protein